tara:strand:+ start:8 stop:601 length:594 start_codon:yes stop_codon:yes gene_type:complete
MIGICAQSRMGKDTFADNLINLQKGWNKTSFASELKKLISTYFDISIDEIEEYKAKEELHPNLNLKVRHTLQLIGETFRTVSPDVWVNSAMRSIHNDMNKIIFTDVRHNNEMDAILNKNGLLILLGRTKYLNIDPHPSESSLKDAIIWFLQNTTDFCVYTKNLPDIPDEYKKFSFFIRNDGTIKNLQESINMVLKKI